MYRTREGGTALWGRDGARHPLPPGAGGRRGDPLLHAQALVVTPSPAESKGGAFFLLQNSPGLGYREKRPETALGRRLSLMSGVSAGQRPSPAAASLCVLPTGRSSQGTAHGDPARPLSPRPCCLGTRTEAQLGGIFQPRGLRHGEARVAPRCDSRRAAAVGSGGAGSVTNTTPAQPDPGG